MNPDCFTVPQANEPNDNGKSGSNPNSPKISPVNTITLTGKQKGRRRKTRELIETNRLKAVRLYTSYGVSAQYITDGSRQNGRGIRHLDIDHSMDIRAFFQPKRICGLRKTARTPRAAAKFLHFSQLRTDRKNHDSDDQAHWHDYQFESKIKLEGNQGG